MRATRGSVTAPPGHAERARRYRERGWWPGVPLAERFVRFVRDRPGAPAVLDDRGRRLNRGQLWREAGQLAAELSEHGVGAGDVVLVFMPNRAECLVAMLAALRRGAVPANIPIRTDEDTLRYATELCGARALLTVDRHGRTATGELSLAAARACPAPPAVAIVAGDGTRRWPRPGTGTGMGTGAESRGRRGRGAEPAHRVEGVDHLLFTSSTTGRPKAVMHTGDTLAALNVAFVERFGLGPDAPIFMPSPLGHSVGAIHGARLALHTGAPLILQDRWDPSRALKMVADHGCRFTAAATPPFSRTSWTWPRRTTPDPGRRSSTPSPGSFAAAPRSPPVAHGAGGGGVPEHPGDRALGDDRGRAHHLHRRQPPREGADDRRGRAPPGSSSAPLDDRGDPTPPDIEGELAMRGPGVFVGYHGQASLYESLLTPGRVLPHRRSRPHRRRRVPQDHRSGEGPHHSGRGEHLPGPPSRTPSPPAPACGRWRWWGIRTSASANGSARSWRTAGDALADPAALTGFLREHGLFEALLAGARPDGRRIPAHGGREDPEDRGPGPDPCGRPGGVHLRRGPRPACRDHPGRCREERGAGSGLAAGAQGGAGRGSERGFRERRTVKVRLGDIEVGYTARGAGAPVVMVHGLAEDRRSWAVAQARLAAARRTLAYDLPRTRRDGGGGTGTGPSISLPRTIGRFIETLTGPAACMGYSLGGTVVLALASARPDLVTHAVVSATSSVVGRAAAGFFEERIALLRSDRAAFEAALRDDTAAQIVTPGADLDAITRRRIEGRRGRARLRQRGARDAGAPRGAPHTRRSPGSAARWTSSGGTGTASARAGRPTSCWPSLRTARTTSSRTAAT